MCQQTCHYSLPKYWLCYRKNIFVKNNVIPISAKQNGAYIMNVLPLRSGTNLKAKISADVTQTKTVTAFQPQMQRLFLKIRDLACNLHERHVFSIPSAHRREQLRNLTRKGEETDDEVNEKSSKNTPSNNSVFQYPNDVQTAASKPTISQEAANCPTILNHAAPNYLQQKVQVNDSPLETGDICTIRHKLSCTNCLYTNLRRVATKQKSHGWRKSEAISSDSSGPMHRMWINGE